jgi:hypothetical protein
MMSAAPRPLGLAAPHDQPVPGHLTTASVLHRAKLLSLPPSGPGSSCPRPALFNQPRCSGPHNPSASSHFPLAIRRESRDGPHAAVRGTQNWLIRAPSSPAPAAQYAVEEEILDHSPAAHGRRPRVDYESHAVALDRNELGALLVAAGLGPPSEHALISMLALNGLRVSEATGADIEHLGLERGHRTLTITRKGGKVVTIPLAPRTAGAIDLAIGERTDGPVFLTANGRRLGRHGPGGSSARPPAAPGSPRPSRPTHCGTRSAPPTWLPECHCATFRGSLARRPGPRCGMTGPAAAWTGTRPTSSQHTSQAPPGNGMSAGKLRPAAAAAGRTCPRPPIPITTRR